MSAMRAALALAIAAGLVLGSLAPQAPDASAQQFKKVVKFGVNRAAENLDPVTQDANQDQISNQPVGSGAYMLVEWKKGEELVMKANPYYYEKGLPRTPELHIRYIPDDNSRIIALQSGEIDGIDYPPFSRVAELRRDSRLEMQLNPSTAVAHLSVNVREAPLSNVKVRQALAYATDRAAIVKAVCFGYCTPATTFLPITTPLFDKGSKGYPTAVSKARQLLKETGVPTPLPVT